jgi:hypothetical protein
MTLPVTVKSTQLDIAALVCLTFNLQCVSLQQFANCLVLLTALAGLLTALAGLCDRQNTQNGHEREEYLQTQFIADFFSQESS